VGGPGPGAAPLHYAGGDASAGWGGLPAGLAAELPCGRGRGSAPPGRAAPGGSVPWRGAAGGGGSVDLRVSGFIWV
jgi:hypothetical protein